MADPAGFLKHRQRELPKKRPVPLRILDWKEVYEDFDHAKLRVQASRCMDCGIPFCHNGCPLGNLIPEWNDLVRTDRWRDAIDRLHATNNFPEFTGRLCPAPCEASCVLGINQDPVTIKQVEVEIIDNAFEQGWVRAGAAAMLTGKTVAVVGSGPAGLAAAQQLTRAGHAVTVFERDDRIGGLLRYGIPEFKMEKRHVDRRLAQMEAEGTVFKAGVNVGVDITADAAARRLRRGGAGRRRHGLARPADPGPRARRHPPGDGVPAVGQPGAAGRRRARPGRRAADHREGQEGHHHRRRRHRRGLPGHRAPAGRGRGAPVRDHAAPAGRARGVDAVAHLSADVPGVVGPRRGRRAGVLGQHRASSPAATAA